MGVLLTYAPTRMNYCNSMVAVCRTILKYRNRFSRHWKFNIKKLFSLNNKFIKKSCSL